MQRWTSWVVLVTRDFVARSGRMVSLVMALLPACGAEGPSSEARASRTEIATDSVEEVYARPEESASVPHREHWPRGSRVVEVESLGAVQVSRSWFDGLDSLRAVARSEEEFRGFWRGPVPQRLPTVGDGKMLVLAGRGGSARPGFGIVRARTSNDSLFVLLGPDRPCPPAGSVQIEVGLTESVQIGRLDMWHGPVVFVEPRECPPPP